MQIYKCDRCKCIIKDYIPILFYGVNQNEIKKEHNLSFLMPIQEYHNKTWELFFNCAEEVLRWLAHQENELTSVQKT